MKWITSKFLQDEFGLSWASSEQLIREQVRLFDKRRDWRAAMTGILLLGGLFWGIFLARLAFPSMHGGRLALLELPGLAVVAFAWLVLPRLMVGDAILAAARQQRDDTRPG